MLFWKNRALNNHFFMADGGDGGGGGDNKDTITLTQSELDKRITAALKTRETSLREEFTAQLAEREAKIKAFEEKDLTEAEKYAKKEKELQEMLDGAKKDRNRAKVESILSKGGFDTDSLSAVIDTLVDIDENKTLDKANAFVSSLSVVIDAKVASQYEEKVKKMPAPKNDDGTPEKMTKEKFDKLTINEQIKFKTENPETAKKFMGLN